MQKTPFSDKQIESYKGSTSRLNLWEGAVRSGKTFISILRFLKALKEGPPGLAMIIGVSRDSIQRNILSELCSLVGAPVPTPKATQISLFNRTIFLVGANDERAQRRIQGSTLAMAYCDELTLLPQGFFKMLLSRLSVAGAQLFGTTNPDSPFHWLKTEFLGNDELDMSVFKFVLDDNPSLSSEYINNLRREYSGLWYKRYIEGQWVLAEGTVYDFFDEELHVIDVPPGPADYYVVGIDYGTCNPTAFTLLGYSKKYYPNLWIEKEYYYDSRAMSRQKSDTETTEDLIAFIGGKNVRCVYVDPSAASFKVEMQRQGLQGVIDANNDVLNGIRYVGNLISNGTFKVCRCCKNTIREFQTYRWDEKVGLKGEDKPIKQFDHCFVAGTNVLTEYGDVPIESIKVGTKVKTRNGWNKVLKTFRHRAHVEDFEILGKKITCTPGHIFLTTNGWKEARDLIQSDILYTDIGEYEWLKLSSLKEENTEDIQSQNIKILEDTIKQMDLKQPKDFDICIERFGNSTMEKFHKDAIFIMLTGTPLTTSLAISNVSQLVSTYPLIKEILQKAKKKPSESMLKESDRLQKNGTKVLKGESGIESTQGFQSQEETLEILCASSAKRLTQRKNLADQDFVQIIVSQNGEEALTLIMRKETVLSAENYLSQTNIQNQKHVQTHARQKKDGLIDVYNLHVENENEFFAERILVHNCLDSARYGVFSHFPGVLTGNDDAYDVEKAYAAAVGLQTELPDFFRTDSSQNSMSYQMPAGFF